MKEVVSLACEVCIEGEKGRICIDICKFMETGRMECRFRERLL